MCLLCWLVLKEEHPAKRHPPKKHTLFYIVWTFPYPMARIWVIGTDHLKRYDHATGTMRAFFMPDVLPCAIHYRVFFSASMCTLSFTWIIRYSSLGLWEYRIVLMFTLTFIDRILQAQLSSPRQVSFFSSKPMVRFRNFTPRLVPISGHKYCAVWEKDYLFIRLWTHKE